MMHRIDARFPLLLAGAWLAASCGFDRVAPIVFPELEIVTPSLAQATRGIAYNESVHAAGGDSAYSWQLASGSLPPGLALSVDDLGEADHAILSGVPESDGVFTFTLTVRSGDGQEASRTYELVVLAPLPLSIETPAVPPGVTGRAYDVRIRAQGGDQNFEFSLVDGALPAGLTLSADGRIHGTPQAADTTTFTVEVRSAGQSVRKGYSLAIVAYQAGEFNITLFPVAPVPAGVLPHLEDAIAEWEAAITGDLPGTHIPSGFFQPEFCGGFGSLLNGTSTDDIIIVINIAPIDGPGGVLGQAGPCGLRGGSDLPFAGVVTLDSEDLDRLVGNETLTFIISHEIAHVLGFGTIWRRMDLISGHGGADPRFVGPRAVQAFQELGGSGTTVPVENQGGEGTRDGHWRQTVFRNERMTGFSAAPGVFQPLSAVSLASFLDKGYDVDLGRADSFALAAALVAPEGHLGHALGHDDILREPIRVLHPDGRTETFMPK
jgi:hypothetical protein